MEQQRSWNDLTPDVLSLIFCRLSFELLLTVVPSVCKSWEKVVKGPACWQNIDIDEWSNLSSSTPDKVHRMVQMLVGRSGGMMHTFVASKISNNSIISLIAHNAGSLRTLRLLESKMSDEVMEREANKFSKVISLDLSYCYNIGVRTIEAMGRNCPQLTTFVRKMYPSELEYLGCQDYEALAIADTMPKLTKLEICNLMVETEPVISIIEKCRDLELLDVRGCWGVWIDNEEMEFEFPKLKILETKTTFEGIDEYDIWNVENENGVSEDDEEEDEDEDEDEEEDEEDEDEFIVYNA